MAKLIRLKGLAYDLADSFVSVTNLRFLKYIESRPPELTGRIEIDLLKGSITPSGLDSKVAKEAIVMYQNWFNKAIGDLEISQESIEAVTVGTDLRVDNIATRHYTYTVSIRAEGKEYSRQVRSSYL